ncbi:MAG TPA: hypothetical protein VG122_00485 [Gemmata sp.]|jgi:hypothetical protein|nr:hypothetical protein [Gemmata sp.]
MNDIELVLSPHKDRSEHGTDQRSDSEENYHMCPSPRPEHGCDDQREKEEKEVESLMHECRPQGTFLTHVPDLGQPVSVI